MIKKLILGIILLFLTFPMRLYDPKKVATKVVSEYNGKNASELARKYGYSLR